MFLEFLYPLVKFFTPFNVFQYLTFRGAYAALTTLLLSFIFGPRIIEALRKFKIRQIERHDGPSSHLAKSAPTMGGLLIIFSTIIAALLWMDLKNEKVWITLGSFIAFGVIGFIDDFLKVRRRNSDGLSAWAKLSMQFVVAIAVTLVLRRSGGDEVTALYVPFFKNPALDLGDLWILFAMLLLVGESNAVNLSDGLDGLATGLLILVFISLAILAYISGRVDYSAYLGIPYIVGAGELTVFCLAAVGACVGFLWYNSYPAEVIMGDVGSLSLGGAVAAVSLIIKKEILILIIGGVFVLEAASVIIQVAVFKLGNKKRFFRMAPLHHHFEESGWAETKVVVRFWILGGLFAIIALSTLKIQ
ncbi:MAG: phospho-N-acetylmuramoyl-pentapeptide-transferase [Treponema sp.]|jgi:phospho-N-acetylmuramoyl-pentapeptide-transferase|nr:phospho-N-acetylmuramoyl-pentapeptide-transferase [Treponema sp.]